MIQLKNKTAANILIAFSIFGISLALLVLMGIVPKDVVWGGRTGEGVSIYLLEAITIIVNLFIIFIVSVRANYIKLAIKDKPIVIVLYILMIIMILNTVGNLFAVSLFEKSLAIVTAISAFCFFSLIKRQ